MMENPRYKGLSVFGPFLFIGLGLVLLLQQLGMIQWSVWDIAFRFWPLLVIAVGVDILVARRSFVGAVAGLIVLLALLLGGIYLLGPGPFRGNELTTDKVGYALEKAASADYDFTSDAGKIQIGPLAAASESLIEGTLGRTVSGSVAAGRTQNDGKAVVSIRTEWPRAYVFSRGDEFLWDLKLARSVPSDIRITLGAGEIDANLKDLQPSAVDLKIGAGSLSLILPAGGDATVNVSVGVGSVTITLPEGAPVSIECTTGIGNCNLPNGSGFWNRSYTSSGFDSAKYHIRITISMGVGEATVA